MSRGEHHPAPRNCTAIGTIWITSTIFFNICVTGKHNHDLNHWNCLNDHLVHELHNLTTNLLLLTNRSVHWEPVGTWANNPKAVGTPLPQPSTQAESHPSSDLTRCPYWPPCSAVRSPCDPAGVRWTHRKLRTPKPSQPKPRPSQGA